MFYVKVYNEDNCYIDAPFNFKEHAIKYFNFICDNPLSNFNRIELLDENVCLFDYEV